jgi:hypothetical protein
MRFQGASRRGDTLVKGSPVDMGRFLVKDTSADGATDWRAGWCTRSSSEAPLPASPKTWSTFCEHFRHALGHRVVSD